MFDITFKNPQTTTYVVINNDPWFRANDVATILGYTNARTTLIYHVDDEDKKTLGELACNESLHPNGDDNSFFMI